MDRWWFTRTNRGGLGRPATLEGWAVFVLFVVALLVIPRRAVEWWYGGPAPTELERFLASLVPTAIIIAGYLLVAKLKTAPLDASGADDGRRAHD